MNKINKKELNKENILDHGVTLLMEQGYHGTGLQEILDAAKVPKGSFYNYFGSKENFGAEVIRHYIDPFITQLAGHLQSADTDALGAIHCYFDVLIAALEQNQFNGGCLLGNLMGEIGDTSHICQESLQSAVSRYRDLLESGFGEGPTTRHYPIR